MGRNPCTFDSCVTNVSHLNLLDASSLAPSQMKQSFRRPIAIVQVAMEKCPLGHFGCVFATPRIKDGTSAETQLRSDVADTAQGKATRAKRALTRPWVSGPNDR
jgi:hypothetical protein